MSIADMLEITKEEFENYFANHGDFHFFLTSTGASVARKSGGMVAEMKDGKYYTRDPYWRFSK